MPLNATAGSCAWCHVVHGIKWQCSGRSRVSQWERSRSCSWHELTADTGSWPTKTFFHTHHLLYFLNSAFSQGPKPAKNPTWKPSPRAQWGGQGRAHELGTSGCSTEVLSSVGGHSQRWPRLKEGTAGLGVPRCPHKPLLVSHSHCNVWPKASPSSGADQPCTQKSLLPLRLHPAMFTFYLVIRQKKIPFFVS